MERRARLFGVDAPQKLAGPEGETMAMERCAMHAHAARIPAQARRQAGLTLPTVFGVMTAADSRNRRLC
jgi:hypothetical protein